ncbi:hypothetical protein CYCD_10340 [Tenuifilaceae bacterium CYCD]|nr:hypothetical protein CYCD_10340 [Tenuifilaceae bacterium CYCD]
MLIPFGVNAQMDNLANMSAKWIRANARNAALDGADVVNYNPAGLVKMSDGIHISLNNQTLFRKPQHSFTLQFGKKSFEQDGADPFLPALYAAYKKDKWAVSSGVYVTGGGASADYPDGSVNTYLLGYLNLQTVNATYGTNYSVINGSLKASSYYIAVPVNFSYSITDKLALSLGGRYIIAKNHTKAELNLPEIASNTTIDYNKNATGFGGIV